MNSVLQSFFVLEPTLQAVISVWNTLSYECQKQQHVLRELFEVYAKYKELRETKDFQTPELEPYLSHFKDDVVGSYNHQFRTHFQQDVVEFAELILACIEEQWNRADLDDANNPVKTLFQIESLMRLTCEHCGKTTKAPPNKTNILGVSIPDEEGPVIDRDVATITLPEVIMRTITAKQELEHKCDACGHNKKCLSSRVQKLPENLIIQMGRYSDDGRKKSRAVEIPFSMTLTLPASTPPHTPRLSRSRSASPCRRRTSLSSDLRDRRSESCDSRRSTTSPTIATDNIRKSMERLNTSGSDSGNESDKENSTGYSSCTPFPLLDSYTYELKSVILHFGGTTCAGHYYAWAKNPLDNDWYKCDDEVVERCDFQEVKRYVERRSYCLFYTKVADTVHN